MGMQDYSVRYETLGLKGSFNTIGASFASAAAAPLAYCKFYAGEGGMRVPLIISGAPITPARAHSRAFSFVTDVAPTILELSGTDHPGGYYGGRAIEPMIGRSLVPVVEGRVERLYGEDDPIGYELAGNAAPVADDYQQQRQVALNGLRDRMGTPVILAVLTLAVLMPFYLFARYRSRVAG